MMTHKDMTGAEVLQVKESVEQAFLSRFQATARLVDSRDWYRESFARSGNWDAWIWDTVHRVDYGTRKTMFQAFVLAGPERVSRAAGMLASLALAQGRPVFGFSEQQGLRLALQAIEYDPEDYASGWEIYYQPFED
jgi:hypothetical protein